jgi:2-phosphoglycerate kinase
MNNFIFVYGVPGAGKTYGSGILKNKLGFSLLEADILRAEAQKDKTPDKDPFLFVGTCQAYKYFGKINRENCIKGLVAVREAMGPIVEDRMRGSVDLIVDGAFLDPNELKDYGKMILITAVDEEKHRRDYFQNRPHEQDKIDEFNSARLVQEYLIKEAQDLNIKIIDNDDTFEQKLNSLSL